MSVWNGRRVEMLAHDGWEEADLYHWMVDGHARGGVIIFMPDVRPGEGPPIAWQDSMRTNYFGLISASDFTRAATLIVLAKQAHDLYEVQAQDG